jgi:hypothetical protein
MHFTPKFILIAVALAHGSTVVSAAPVGKSSESVAARSDDMELFVREPEILRTRPSRLAPPKPNYSSLRRFANHDLDIVPEAASSSAVSPFRNS